MHDYHWEIGDKFVLAEAYTDFWYRQYVIGSKGEITDIEVPDDGFPFYHVAFENGETTSISSGFEGMEPA